MKDIKQVVEFAKSLAKGEQANYSKTEMNETLRNAFAELFELEDGKGISRKQFRKYKTEIFEILEEVLNETINEGLRDQFEGFAEYRYLPWGDTNVFHIPANPNFRVAMVSDGNSNIRRQRLRDGQELTVSLDTYAVKIGEDFHRFLANRTDWATMLNGISEAFKRDLTQRIADAVYNSYGRYGATYHNTFTATGGATPFTTDDLIEMAMHIEARTGSKVAVYGTKLALRRLEPDAVSEALINEKNQIGHYQTVAGIPLREIEQSHKYGTDDFAISNDFLLILPEDADKMVKIVNEGDAVIADRQGTQNADMMQEYFVANRFGVSLINTKVFGFVKFN